MSDDETTGLSFEQMLERLRTTVEKLEGGQLSLEESLTVFEEGVRLQRTCTRRLDAAEKRIETLLAVDRGGEPETAPVDLPGDG